MSAVLMCVCHEIYYSSAEEYVEAHRPGGEVRSSYRAERYLATFGDGRGVLVEVVAPGSMVVATRSRPSRLWSESVPLDLVS